MGQVATVQSRRPHLVWRLSAVTALALLVWLGRGWMSDHLYDGLSPLGRHTVNAVVTCLLTVVLVLAARRYLDRRPWSGLRLTGPRAAWWPFTVGALSWLVPAAAGTALCLALGWSGIDVRSSPGEAVGAVALLLVLVLVFEAFPEELLFRGYLHRNLSASVAPWLAVLGQALLFTLFGTTLWVVSSGWDVLVERSVIFFGMAVSIGCLRVITGNVWACVGYHLAFQVVAQFLLGGRYAEVDITGEGALTLATFAAALTAAPAVAALLTRSSENWRTPEPDESPSSV
ncbi:hypothetical protein FHX37_3255 [Haloactinospora alba]|uniref:CAAX prenyl protease 2/Lysostaphin resistance protein A-like domain-containing protein n=1 Tax=Haloactinospora alba TaxID=405555 RepID=A0A543NN43_9ACTN|nr:CPBP family intramembrane glutamic endopeptidase [Haloactinospora alba]TQN33250.1 hypothetical protein FHX37_3255 [Haloactinospora alba]